MAALVTRGNLDDLVAAGDVAHRGDDDGRAAGADFGEGLELLKGNRAGLDGHAEIGRELLEGVVRHRREDGGGVRRDVRAVRLDAEEVRGREFLDEFMALGVEVELDREARVLGRLVGVEAGGVVAGDLDVADALGGGAVVVVVDRGGDGLEAALVVGADRHDHDEEGVFVGRGDADLRAGADEERADVEGAAGAVWRDVVEVVVHDALEGVHEHVRLDGGHARADCGAVHALGVGLRPEGADLAVLAPEDLEALECGLPVVERGGRDTNLERVVLDELALVPGAVPPSVADVAVGLHVAEAQA